MDIDPHKHLLEISNKIYDLLQESPVNFNECDHYIVSLTSIISGLLVELKKTEPLRTDRLLYHILGTLEEVYYKENK